MTTANETTQPADEGRLEPTVRRPAEKREVSGAPRDRSEYMRAYYAANKAKLNARRKTYSRELARAAKARYLEKKRLLAEIAAMPVPTIEDA
mgnify:CR=1 FL=1